MPHFYHPIAKPPHTAQTLPNPPPPPKLIEGEEEYEVDQICAHQHKGCCRTLQYLIKWKGYPESNNT
jgi:hypothetical protein